MGLHGKKKIILGTRRVHSIRCVRFYFAQKKIEDTKGWKDNGQRIQTTTHKAKDWAARITLITGMNSAAQEA